MRNPEQDAEVGQMIVDLWPGDVAARKVAVYLKRVAGEPTGIVEVALEELAETHKLRPTPQQVAEACADVREKMRVAGFGTSPEHDNGTPYGNEPTFATLRACNVWRRTRGLPELVWHGVPVPGVDVDGHVVDDVAVVDHETACRMAPANVLESRRKVLGR